jgi:hypothetical protein
VARNIREKKVWQCIFPLQIGDRVRIVSASYYDKAEKLFIGRTGTISYATRFWKGPIDDIFVTLDHAAKGVFHEVHLHRGDVVRIKERKKRK